MEKTTQDLIKGTISHASEEAGIARATLQRIDELVARAERVYADKQAEFEALQKSGAAAEDEQVRRLVKLILAGKEATHLRDAGDEALLSELLTAKQQVSVAAKALAQLVEARAPLAAADLTAEKSLNNLVRAEHRAVQQRMLGRLREIASEYNDTCRMTHALGGIQSGIPGDPFVLDLGVSLDLGPRQVGGPDGAPPMIHGFPDFGPHRALWESYFANYRAGNPVEMPKPRERNEEKIDRMISEAVDNYMTASRADIERMVADSVAKVVPEAMAVH